eukprot:TRINITY_DN602_c0_g1_i2.p1 TRINITY_DN602_c0_g1~~TRINITY_DN602_c0_g1_i2.p1  ORF type:complete len:214 (-),score=37.55 TRINITY_DN602_c0_g1_i2:61-702(-)
MDLLYRLYSGLQPFGKNFFDRISPNPDLYGPFWVSTTVLFILAAVSNLAGYFTYWKNGEADLWTYDYKKVTFAACAIYGYLVVCSVVFWLVEKYWFKIGLSLVECFSVYGYSFTCYTIATIICVLPYNWLQWVIISLCCVDSTVVLCWSLFPRVNKVEVKKWVPTLIVIALLHIALALTFKLYFFNFKINPPIKPSVSSPDLARSLSLSSPSF